jgi:hypothetical protein
MRRRPPRLPSVVGVVVAGAAAVPTHQAPRPARGHGRGRSKGGIRDSAESTLVAENRRRRGRRRARQHDRRGGGGRISTMTRSETPPVIDRRNDRRGRTPTPGRSLAFAPPRRRTATSSAAVDRDRDDEQRRCRDRDGRTGDRMSLRHGYCGGDAPPPRRRSKMDHFVRSPIRVSSFCGEAAAGGDLVVRSVFVALGHTELGVA